MILHNERPGVDAVWTRLFPFPCYQSRATLAGSLDQMSERILQLLLASSFLLLGCRPKYKKDPRLDAAIAEAKATLTNFVGVMQSPRSNQMFFRVLAWFPSKPPDYNVGVWANVWKYENGSFLGSVPQGNSRIGRSG